MSLTAYNRINLMGVEVLASDPVSNLFTGRVYYNSATDELRTYNGTIWVAGGGGGFSKYTKFVGPGETYTTLEDMAAALVTGDFVLVKGVTDDVNDVAISTDLVTIEWLPDALSEFSGGGHVDCLTISADNVRLINPNLFINAGSNIDNGVVVSGATFGAHIDRANITLDATGSFTLGVLLKTSGNNAIITAAAYNNNPGSLTVTTVLDDTGTNIVQVVGP